MSASRAKHGIIPRKKDFPGIMRRFANIFLLCIICGYSPFFSKPPKWWQLKRMPTVQLKLEKNVEIFIFNWFESNDVWYLRKISLSISF